MMKLPLFKRFCRDNSGQFAIMFAVVLIPLVAGVGFAIDYAGALQSRTRLRDATDAAAFYAATEYRKDGKLPTSADVLKFVSENYGVSNGEQEPKILSMALVDGRVVLKTEVIRPLAFMGVMGNADTPIAVASTIHVGKDEDLEIALALDTTYSMTKSADVSADELDPTGTYVPPGTEDIDRITALKVAALRFTDAILGQAGATQKRRISVVPFSRYVNVGLAQRGQSWLDVPPDTAASGTQCTDFYHPIIGYSDVCQPASYIYDGVEITYNQCQPIYGSEKIQTCWPTGWSTWRGCVGSRNEPYNLNDPVAGKKFTGLMNTSCGTELLPLTSDKVAVASRISALHAYDHTYIPEGVMWGMRTLTDVAPFTEASKSSKLKKVRKILVLMTDGDNQAVADIPYAPTHEHITEPNARHAGTPDYYAKKAKTDDWTLKACNEAKSAEIEVYTISFGTDLSASAKSILRNCATDSQHYFDAKDAEALSAAFLAISAKVNAIYLAG
jgi:Flp pilus assembly protein TadG